MPTPTFAAMPDSDMTLANIGRHPDELEISATKPKSNLNSRCRAMSAASYLSQKLSKIYGNR